MGSMRVCNSHGGSTFRATPAPCELRAFSGGLQAPDPADFDLDTFAQYRRIRILTYSSSVPMLRTVLERFEESSVESVLGYSRVVNNMASVIAHCPADGHRRFST